MWATRLSPSVVSLPSSTQSSMALSQTGKQALSLSTIWAGYLSRDGFITHPLLAEEQCTEREAMQFQHEDAPCAVQITRGVVLEPSDWPPVS